MLNEWILRLFSDQDIRSGAEALHPSIRELLNSARSRADVPPDILETLLTVSQMPNVGGIDPKGKRIVFLLGAGASKPAPSNIPVTKELLRHLFTSAERSNREEVTQVAEFCKRHEIENIEDLLTAAQVATFCSRNPAILKLTEFLLYRDNPDEPGRRFRRAFEVSSIALLQDTFQMLFASLSGIMLPAKPNACHTAIASFAQEASDTVFITTNYDLCIDLALQEAGHQFSYGIEFANQPSVGGSASTRLLKLHGSLNWFYCETCQKVQLVDITKMLEDFEQERSPYPVIGVCKTCSGQRRGMAVPPLAMKFDFFPPLTPLINAAEQAFNNADLVVAIGFSFADADLYISRMISKALQAKPAQQLIIVDPSSDVADRVQRRLTRATPGFSAERVRRIPGDCAELVPRFLSGELRDSDKPNGILVDSEIKIRSKSHESSLKHVRVR